MKVPRDVDADRLITILKRNGYTVVRQTGSHIRLSKIIDNGEEHNITVPNHKPIKIGTLQSIVSNVCMLNKLDIRKIYLDLS